MIPPHLADLPLIWLVIAVVVALDVGIVLVWRRLGRQDRTDEKVAVITDARRRAREYHQRKR